MSATSGADSSISYEEREGGSFSQGQESAPPDPEGWYRPGQGEIVAEFARILTETPRRVVLNTTVMGGGKTHMTLGLARRLGLAVAVVAPAGMVPMWEAAAAGAGVPAVFVASFERLRGNRRSGVWEPTPWLAREDPPEGEPRFAATPRFAAAAARGLLLVVDEVSYVKNRVSQFRAVAALLDAAADSGRSRGALLSAMPVNEREHAANLLRLLGFYRADELFCLRDGAVDLRGLRELAAACAAADPGGTAAVLARHEFGHAAATTIAFELFVGVAKAATTRALSSRLIGIDHPRDVANSFYELRAPGAEAALAEAIAELSRATRFNERTLEARSAGMGALTKALMRIEGLMLEVFERKARADLAEAGVKVVLCLNYVASAEELARRLAGHAPLLLTGKVPVARREEAAALFRAPGGARLLVTTTRTGGYGLSLHDTDGRWPRRVYISPTYSIQTLHQATGRVYRQGTRSPVKIRVVYARRKLLQIIDSLARQSDDLGAVLDQQVADGVVFPGHYPEAADE